MKLLDLYCGAGGLSFGFEMTKAYATVAGIDIYQPALDSFYQNHLCSESVLEKYARPTDLSDEVVRKSVIHDFHDVEIIIGGPPCQGFSVAGKRLDDFLLDSRNHQVFNFLDIVRGIQPKAFVMENVRGITSTGQKDKYSIINQLIERFDEIGYLATWKVLSAEDFFVPQKRRRMFLVGIKKGRPAFSFPTARCGVNNNLFEKHFPFTTVREAIGDLPYPNDGEALAYDKAATCWYQRLMRESSTQVQGHSTTKHGSSFVKRLAELKVGEKLYPSWNHSWVKLNPDELAPTIKENHRAPGLHYERPMSISPRECARLQSMPDRFVLSGTKSQRLVQVGNAVPPLLAASIATALADTFGVGVSNRYGIPKATLAMHLKNGFGDVQEERQRS